MRATKLAAITLSGGAALSLLAPATAFAGDADSTGNRASTDHGQQLTATSGSDPSVSALNAGEVNGGGATANAGGNTGTGNSGDSSSDDATDEQVNTDSVGNESEGSVANATGNAKATGNESTSKLRQAGTLSGTGGGFQLVGQNAFILNAGGAYANTGFNDGDANLSGDATAWGNRASTDVAQWARVADGGGGLRLVNQDAAVLSLGLAVAETGFNVGDAIESGDATAGGSDSTTTASQGASITETPTGPALSDQDGLTTNAGVGIANTGRNETTGDDSTNEP